MTAALLWGVLAASSLLLGAVLGIARSWPRRATGSVLAFGAGALISAVSFDLARQGVRIGGGLPVAAGLAVGALTYYAADLWLDRVMHDSTTDGGDGAADTGTALALGAFLDGIPEQAVLGIGLAIGNGVSVGLLAAVFISNLPEAVGSASAMRESGRGRWPIMRLWLGIAAICALATPIGYAIAGSTSGQLQAGIDGFAAGALLVMLVDSMIPQARLHAGKGAGLLTVLGFAIAAGLSTITG